MDQPKEEKLCVHHGQPLVFFCESCEEPICRNCSILGPHNSQLHRLNSIENSAKTRMLKLRQSINSSLLQKKDQLMAQTHRIEYRIEEIKYVKTLIERDVRAEYSGILERLKSAEGLKTTVLQHEMAELQKDLEMINDLGNTYLELTGNNQDPINFLLRSRNLYENLEYLLAKPFKVSIDVYPYDLPRELTEKRAEFEKLKAFKQILDFKDEIIFKLLQKKKTDENKLKEELDKSANVEISEWAKLTDQFAQQLKKIQMVCYFCADTLDEHNVNSQCLANQKSVSPEGNGFTENAPEQQYFGTQRHFFGKPNERLINQAQQTKIKSTQRQLGQLGLSMPQNEGLAQFEIQLAKIRKAQVEKGVDLIEVLQKFDKHNQRTLNYIQFAYILSEELNIDSMDIDKIIKNLDPNNSNVIHYDLLLKYLSQENAFQNYEQ